MKANANIIKNISSHSYHLLFPSYGQLKNININEVVKESTPHLIEHFKNVAIIQTTVRHNLVLLL